MEGMDKDILREVYYQYIFRSKRFGFLAEQHGLTVDQLKEVFNNYGLLTRRQIINEEPECVYYGDKKISTGLNRSMIETHLGRELYSFMSTYPTFDELIASIPDLIEEKNKYYESHFDKVEWKKIEEYAV